MKDDINPIFICGYPKSGTTLLVSLLDGHSELLVIPEETKYFKMVLGAKIDQKFEILFKKTNIAALSRGIVDEPSGYRDYSNIDFNKLLSFSKDIWERSEKKDKDLFESLVAGYSKVTGKSHYKYWVEKTPKNELYLPIINKMWPKAKIIYIIRDPRQTYCSHKEYKKVKSSKKKVNADEFTVQFEKSFKAINDFITKKREGIIIKYEDLVRETENVMKRISQYLEIQFENKLVIPTRAGTIWKGNSAFKEKYEGVGFRKNNYFEILEEKEINIIELNLMKIMIELNYPIKIKYNKMNATRSLISRQRTKINMIARKYTKSKAS